MAKKQPSSQPVMPSDTPVPEPTPPGFSVSRKPGPGSPAGPAVSGIEALRARLDLSGEPDIQNVCAAAVARIDELQSRLDKATQVKVDVRSKADARKL